MTATVENWIIYAAARGDARPSGAGQELASQALLRAQDYITQTYVNYFLSQHDENSAGVDEAIYIAAGLELATPNFFSSTYTPSDQKMLTQLDVIKWTPVNSVSGASAARPVSTQIEALLDRYMRYNPNSSVTRTQGGFVV